MDPIFAQSLLEPNAGLIVWKTIAFAILLWLLYKFAWGPITSALKERETRIDESMQRAEKALEEAREIQAENEKARREAEKEAQRILREARESAEALRKEEIEKTRARIEQMQKQAQAEIERQKQGALEELRGEIIDLAIEAASKVVREDLDESRQRRLVDDFIDGLPQKQN